MYQKGTFEWWITWNIGNSYFYSTKIWCQALLEGVRSFIYVICKCKPKDVGFALTLTSSFHHDWWCWIHLWVDQPFKYSYLNYWCLNSTTSVSKLYQEYVGLDNLPMTRTNHNICLPWGSKPTTHCVRYWRPIKFEHPLYYQVQLLFELLMPQ